MARYANREILRMFRADAAFDIPPLYDTLETEDYWVNIGCGHGIDGAAMHPYVLSSGQCRAT